MAWLLVPVSAAARSPRIVVAVIDGGVDITHPALRNHLWRNPRERPGNGRDDERDGIVDDVHGASMLDRSANVRDDSGHGTHVAGIVAHYAPRAKIMVLKAGAGHGLNVPAAARAIRYAVNHGARVINMSWSLLDGDPALAEAIRYAAARQVLLVAAAGNLGLDSDRRPTYPAAYLSPNLVSVAATCDGRALASFSDFGKLHIGLAAPGCDIRSTAPGGGWGVLSGTSMSAPAVSGTAALLLARRPRASASAVARALLGGARPEAGLANVLAAGAVLDVRGALRSLAGGDRVRPARFAAIAPGRTFTTQRDPTYYYQEISFSWTPSRDASLAGYRVLVDGAPTAATGPEVSSVTRRIGPGRHSWTVVAYDRSGNRRAARGRSH